MLYHKMLLERKHLEQKITHIQNLLARLPEGKLTYSKNGGYTKWYKSDGKHYKYIPRSDHKLAEQLAVKKYLSAKLKDLMEEQKAIDFYLRHHKSTPDAENPMNAIRFIPKNVSIKQSPVFVFDPSLKH